MREKLGYTLLISLIIIFLHFPSGNSDSPAVLAPALYVFGDSLVDSGNNNYLPTIARANYRPYGVDFPKGRPTGRFTDGKTAADLIAEFLGLPLPPAYLSLRSSDTLTGLNYASAACGILPETGSNRGKCLNLDDQINLFQQTVKLELPSHNQSSEELAGYLSKSIFLIAIGSNDYLGYVQSNVSDTSKRLSPQSFAQLLIDKLSHEFERLYKLGARKVVMFEIGPIGCIPDITGKYKHNGKCVEEFNKPVSLFNNQLATMLRNLTSTLQGSAFILGHSYWLGYDAILNPSRYGLKDSRNPCCITFANATCIPLLAPCTNVRQHCFWDGYHPTEEVNSLIATSCFNGTSVCIPLNIKELSQS